LIERWEKRKRTITKVEKRGCGGQNSPSGPQKKWKEKKTPPLSGKMEKTLGHVQKSGLNSFLRSQKRRKGGSGPLPRDARKAEGGTTILGTKKPEPSLQVQRGKMKGHYGPPQGQEKRGGWKPKSQQGGNK